MQIVNFAVASIGTGGGIILAADVAKALLAEGMEFVGINPSVDIVLADSTLGQGHANIPGSIAGSTANSPWTCSANTVTTVQHRGGPIYGISTSGTATVKYSGGLVP